MNTSTAAWLVIFLMAVAANFPFVTDSFFGVYRFKGAPKSFGIILFEFMVFYFFLFGIAH